jgi:hypothetical protein
VCVSEREGGEREREGGERERGRRRERESVRINEKEKSD